MPRGNPATSSPNSSTRPLARRIRMGGCPAELNDKVREFEVEDAQAERDELLFDAGGKQQVVELVGRRAGRILGEDAVTGVAGKLGHHERRGHTLARDVAHRHRASIARQLNEVVVVSAHLVSGIVVGKEFEPAIFGNALRQEPLLHLFGQLQVAIEPFAFQE